MLYRYTLLAPKKFRSICPNECIVAVKLYTRRCVYITIVKTGRGLNPPKESYISSR